MRAVRFKISPELLVEALGMPKGTELILLRDEPYALTLYVTHPDFPEVAEGDDPPLVMPLLTIDYDNGPREWITWEWRL